MRQLSTAHTNSVLIDTHGIREPLDDAHRRRYCEVIFLPVAHRNPSASPDAEHTNRRPQGTIRFLSRFTPWSTARATTRPRIMRSDRTALRPQARASDSPTPCVRARHGTHARQSRNRHTVTALRLSVADALGAALSAAHPQQNEHTKPASTFNMGRRIMAERRRRRRERRREHRPHARANANNQIDARCDEPLRAFVRALARQAARELFEAQLKRHSAEIH